MAADNSPQSHRLRADIEAYNLNVNAHFHRESLQPHDFTDIGSDFMAQPANASITPFQLSGNIDPVLIGLADSSDVDVSQIPFDVLNGNLSQHFTPQMLPQEALNPLMISSQSDVQSAPWINEFHEEDIIMNSSTPAQYTQKPNSKRLRVEPGYGPQMPYSPSALSSSPQRSSQQENPNVPLTIYHTSPQQHSDDGSSLFERSVLNPDLLHPRSTRRESQVQHGAPPTSPGRASRQVRGKEKKYPCRYCTRDKSFTTTNDLDRHLRTVHGILKKGDRIYMCAITGCTSSTKIWPRLDNFKQHVARMHPANLPDSAEEMYHDYDPERHGQLVASPRGRARGNTMATSNDSLDPVSSSMMTNITPPQAHSAQPIVRQEFTTFNQVQPRNVASHTRATFDARSDLNNSFNTTTLSGHGLFTANRASIVEARRWNFAPTPFGQSTPGNPSDHNQRQLTLADRHTLAGPELSGERQSVDQNDLTLSSEHHEISTSSADFAGLGGGLSVIDNQMPIGNVSLGGLSTIQLNAEGSSSTDITAPLQKLLHSLSAEHGQIFADLLRAPTKSREIAAGILRNPHLKSADQSERSRSVASKSSSKGKKADDQKILRCGVEVKDQNGEARLCLKPFDKKSELKKHEKRHLRIYGCTFDRCYKRFGTKWEWKRHEHRQHSQSELWRCQALLEGGRTCAQIFHDDIGIKKHLGQQHRHNEESVDHEDIEKFAERCRLAKKWLGPYWCGFCKEIVQQSPTVPYGADMVKERDIHVSSHIDHEEHVMDQWVELQGGGKTKGQMQNPDDSDSDCEMIAEEEEDEDEDEGPQVVARPRIYVDTTTEMTRTQPRMYRSNRNSLTRTVSPITPMVQVISPDGRLFMEDEPQDDIAYQQMNVDQQEIYQSTIKVCYHCGSDFGELREQSSTQCPACEQMLYNNSVCGYQGWT